MYENLEVNIPFQVTWRKPIQERKLMGISYTFAKIVNRLKLEWKENQVIAKIDEKHTGTPEETWVYVDGYEIPTFTFCMGKKLIKLVYERKLNNEKNI